MKDHIQKFLCFYFGWMFVISLYLLIDRYEGITMFFGRLLFFPLFLAIAFYLYEVTAPTLHKFFPCTFTNTGRRVNPQDVKRRKDNARRPRGAGKANRGDNCE
jgi:hypothetical protein